MSTQAVVMPWIFVRLRARVLLVTVATVGGDAAGVPQGGSGLVLHGVLSPRQNAAPQELTFSQSFVQLSNQDGRLLTGVWRQGV